MSPITAQQLNYPVNYYSGSEDEDDVLVYREIFLRIEEDLNVRIQSPMLFNNHLFNSPIEIEDDDVVDRGDLILRFRDQESPQIQIQILVADYFRAGDELGE
jgi:hypothetical protein